MKRHLQKLFLLCALILATSVAKGAITAVEYFIDTDPGQGNGVAVPVQNVGEGAPIQVQVPPTLINQLAPGTHMLACRVRDEAGNWSIAFSRPFFKEYLATANASPIVAVEYFFDNDPGPGLGNIVSVANADTSLSTPINVPPNIIGALTDGTHTMGVRVQNADGNWSISSARTFFKETVPDVAPTITQHPVDRTVNPGASVTFSVTATGSAPLFYQWRKDGVNIPSANSNSFTIQSVQGANAGLYTVVVTNSAGQRTSLPGRLTVNAPPSITAQPMTLVRSQGTTATFTVVAAGTAPFTYQWKKEGQDLPGQTAATLTLSNLEPSNIGRYTVTIRNVAGEITSRAASLSLLDIDMYPGLTIHGPVGARYRIDFANSVDATNWTALTEVVLTESPYTFSDYSAPRVLRFYRATLLVE